MITEPTVFVIGAGAHCPYGFPDGAKLLREMLASLPQKENAQTEFSSALSLVLPSASPVNFLPLREFGEALQHAGHTSIDSFLATHSSRPSFSEIGKLLAAWHLMPHEFAQHFDRSPIHGDWLSYLFSHMVQGCLTNVAEFLSHNRASFVTFNYDRTLEYFLTTRLMHTYNLSFQAALAAMYQIPIVHVYGSLGTFEEVDRVDTRRLRQQPELWSKAANSIRLMYEHRDTADTEIDAAKRFLTGGTRVCFLGFSFDPDNIKRLSLNNVCNDRLIIASRFQVADGEWNRARSAMKPSDLTMWFQASRDLDALTILRESPILS